MADSKVTPVLVRFTQPYIDAIDEWRRSQQDLPTRPEAIRRLSEIALKAAGERQKVRA